MNHGASDGEKPNQQPADPIRQADAQPATQRAEHHAFHQQLADEPRACGADRHPQRDLPPPRRPPRQEKIGHVGASDRQHQPHHAHQHVERAGELAAQAGEPGCSRQQHRFRSHPLRKPARLAQPDLRGKLRLNIPIDHLQPAVRLRRGDARLEPAEDREPLHDIDGPPQPVLVLRRHLRLHHYRHVHVRSVAHLESIKAGRGYTHDGERTAADQHLFADRGRSASEAALPVRIADHRHRMAARYAIVLRRKEPPCCRRHAQNVVVVAGDKLAHGRFGIAVHAYTQPDAVRIRRELAEEWLLPPQAPVGFIVVGVVGVAFPLLAEEEQRLRIPHRQRLEEQCVDQPEDRRVGADAQRQRNHRHHAEARILAQHPQAVPRVLPDPFQPGPPPGFADRFLQPRRVAQPSPRGELRIARGQPCLPLVFGFQFQMGAQFALQVLFAIRAPSPEHVSSPRPAT